MTEPKKKRGLPEAAKPFMFKKGESGNPLGRIPNPALKALKNLTIETYREVIELAMTSDLDALDEVIDNPRTPAVQVGVAKALRKAIDNADWNILEQIAARIVGKIPDVVTVNSTNNTSLSVIDERKLLEAMKKLESDV